MAFVQQGQKPGASGNILTGAPQGASAPAGVSVPQALGAQAPSSKGAQAPRFEGIRKYLEANKPQVEKLGEKVAGQVSGQAQAVREGIQQAQQNLGQLQQTSQNLQKARTVIPPQAQQPVQAQAAPDNQMVSTMPVSMPGDTAKPVLGETAFSKPQVTPQEPEFVAPEMLSPIDQRSFGQEGFLQSAIGRLGGLDERQMSELGAIVGGNFGRDLLSKDFTAGLAQRGQALSDLQKQVGSEAGRAALLRKSLNPTQYSSGEAALDSALFNMAAPNIRRAQQTASAESQAYKQALSGLTKQQQTGRDELLKNIEETRTAAKTGLEGADTALKTQLESAATKQRTQAEKQATAAREALTSFRPLTDADKNSLRSAGYTDENIKEIENLNQAYAFDPTRLQKLKFAEALANDPMMTIGERENYQLINRLFGMSDADLQAELQKQLAGDKSSLFFQSRSPYLSQAGQSQNFINQRVQRLQDPAAIAERNRQRTEEEARQYSQQRYDQLIKPILGREGLSEISGIEGPQFSDIDAGSVASTQDYAKYDQLSRLLGRQPTLLQQGNISRAGTAADTAKQKQQQYNQSVLDNISALNAAVKRQNPGAASSGSSGGVNWGDVALGGVIAGPVGGLSQLFRGLF
jgi:hypothetical protein